MAEGSTPGDVYNPAQNAQSTASFGQLFLPRIFSQPAQNFARAQAGQPGPYNAPPQRPQLPLGSPQSVFPSFPAGQPMAGQPGVTTFPGPGVIPPGLIQAILAGGLPGGPYGGGGLFSPFLGGGGFGAGSQQPTNGAPTRRRMVIP